MKKKIIGSVLLFIVVVSLLTPEPEQEIYDEFDKVKRMTN